MNLLLIGVLLAIIAIAYQIGLSKSRNLAGKGNNSGNVTFTPRILWRVGSIMVWYPCFFNFDCLELG